VDAREFSEVCASISSDQRRMGSIATTAPRDPSATISSWRDRSDHPRQLTISEMICASRAVGE
jgi:hypothetical protein